MISLKRKLSLGIALVLAFSITIVPINVHAQQEEDLREIRTYTGSKEASYVNGTLSESRFNAPSSFVVLNNDSIVVADSGNHAIRLLNSATTTTLAGGPVITELGSDHLGALLDGDSQDAIFNNPGGLAVDKAGNIIVADTKNHAIRKINTKGVVTTIAGNGLIGATDGQGQAARFYEPQDVAIDSKGNIYVADTLNHTIRVIDTNGRVKTLTSASSRVVEYGSGGIVEDAGDFLDGTIANAKFNEPVALLIDDKDNVYVADRGNQRLRYIDFASNTVSTVAGSGQVYANDFYVEGDYKDGTALKAAFNSPTGLAWLDDETLLIADSQNHVIRQLKHGEVTTIVGQVEQFGYDNGLLTHATLNEPVDVLVQEDGSILILENMANQVRKLASYDKFITEPFSSSIEVFVNGRKLNTEVQLVNGRTLIPLRALSEAIGLSITYDPSTEQITLSNDDVSFKLIPHSDKVTVSKAGQSEELQLDVPTALVNDRSFVPVRFISEQLGLNVAWDHTYRNVVVRENIYIKEVN